MLIVFYTSFVGTLWVYNCWVQFLSEGFPLDTHPGIFVSFRVSVHFNNQSVVDDREFSKPESMYAITVWHFFCLFLFFVFCTEWIGVYFRLWAFLGSLELFFSVVYSFGFFVMFSSFPCFAPKFFLFPCIWHVSCLRQYLLMYVLEFVISLFVLIVLIFFFSFQHILEFSSLLAFLLVVIAFTSVFPI